MFSMGTCGKQYENICFPWKPLENLRKTHVFRWDLWKTIGEQRFIMGTNKFVLRKHMFSVGTYGKHKENTRCPWEPMENIMKTHVFRGNQWKTL